MVAAWAVPNPVSKYGGAFLQAPVATPTQMAAASAAGPAPSHAVPAWSTESPMLWIGVITAVTFGLMAFSTTVRVGPAKLSAGVGAT